jgi:hypothetical protein
VGVVHDHRPAGARRLRDELALAARLVSGAPEPIAGDVGMRRREARREEGALPGGLEPGQDDEVHAGEI